MRESQKKKKNDSFRDLSCKRTGVSHNTVRPNTISEFTMKINVTTTHIRFTDVIFLQVQLKHYKNNAHFLFDSVNEHETTRI